MDNNRIRSMQFVDSYFPLVDGVVETVHHYAALMNDEKAAASVVCPKALGDFDDGTLPYKVFRSPSIRLKVWDYSVATHSGSAFMKQLAAWKPDILHVHSPFTQRGSAVRLAKALNIPLIATFHTKYYDDVYRISKSRHAAEIVTDNIVGFYNKCDCVWACSSTTADTLRSYGYDGEIDVMPNGTDIKLPEDPVAVRKMADDQFRFEKDKHILLFVGSLVWQKNIRLALDTMKVLKESSQDHILYFAGKGYYAEQIKQYAASIGLDDSDVKFLGRIEDRELLAGVMLNADLLFFPSVYDNAPLVLRESAALGLPALLVEGSNAAEVVTDGVNGFTAKEKPGAMAARIKDIFAEPSELKRAGAKAAETIPVPWEEIVPLALSKYSEIISNYHKR